MIKKRILLIAAVILLLAGGVPVYGAEGPSQKDEVVYADLSQNGGVKDIYVVNIFENQDSILDYGNYQKVRNMTSSDRIVQKGDKITIATKDDRLYYQGNVDGGEIPWDINVTYFLDHNKIKPEEMAGKSGNLKIQIEIKENKKAVGDFFDQYAMQITAALNTETCRNIKTSGATEANVGGKKQMTWTLMPGTEKTLEVTASVDDFEMDSISFNGVRLEMDVDVDNKALTEKFDRLSAAVKAIDTGAKDLSAGAGQLDQGTGELKKGAASLEKNVDQLSKATKKTEALSDASTEINGGIAALSQGIDQLKEGISYHAYKKTMKENGLDIDQLKESNKKLRQTIDTLQAAYSQAMTPELKQQLLPVIEQTKQLLDANIVSIQGMEQYLDGAGENLAKADKSVKKLKTSYKQFDGGVQELTKKLGSLDTSQINPLMEGVDSLKAGSSQLKEGSDKLADGTGTLNGKTSQMSGQVDSAIDEMLSGISGEKGKITSFVSEKNTNVRAVQFVVKSDPIEVPEKEVPAESEEKSLTWWQKLLDLLGLY